MTFSTNLIRLGRPLAIAACLALAVGDVRGASPVNGIGVNGFGRAPARGDNGAGKGNLDFGVTPDTNGACGNFELPTPSPAIAPGATLELLSAEVRSHIEACQCQTQDCIADVLDKYADKLAILTPRLAPPLRNLSKVVSRAAVRVRAAKSKTDAVRILRQAAAQVHQEIELLRADNSETIREQTRGGEAVENTLGFAAIKLERADGI